MIASSRVLKGAALAGAVALHGGLILALMADAPAEIEGAAGAGGLRLGSSFADMAAGRLTPSDARHPADPVPPMENARADPNDRNVAPPSERAILQPVQPEATLPATRTAVAQSAPPKPAAPTPAPQTTAPLSTTADAIPETPRRTAPTTAAPPFPVLSSDAATAIPARSPRDRMTSTPERARSVAESFPAARRVVPETPQTRTDPAPSAQRPATPTPSEPAQPVEADNRVTAADPTSAAPARSLRPPARRPEAAPPSRSADTAEARPEPAQAEAPRGNADRNARAGQASGRETGTARSSGAASTSQAAGNAAASNYPGAVMARLSQVRRPNVNARGSAVVAFRIASGGGLTNVSLARSSGSSALDRAALQLVRLAAPFPPPPQGARRNFSIAIAGR